MTAIARVAFGELARAGVRTVGEFHYVHHQADGTPYDDRTILSEALIHAAKAEGLRVALLRVAYHRAGPGLPAEPGQRRFCDPKVDDVLGDVDAASREVRGRFRTSSSASRYSLGQARVPLEWLTAIGAYAAKARPDAPHARVVSSAARSRRAGRWRRASDEAPRRARGPLAALRCRRARDSTSRRTRARLLGAARAVRLHLRHDRARPRRSGSWTWAALRSAGARLCTGVDSHVVTDPIEELRALETHERLRAETSTRDVAAALGHARRGVVARRVHRALRRGVRVRGRGGDRPRARSPRARARRRGNLLDAIVFPARSASLVVRVEALDGTGAPSREPLLDPA